MGTNTPKKLSETAQKVNSISEKLKNLYTNGSSAKDVIATLKGAISYMEHGDQDVQDFEKYLLSNNIYGNLVELPGIKDSLSEALENPTFLKAKNEFMRHKRAGRLDKANKFLEKMKEFAKSDEEKEYIANL